MFQRKEVVDPLTRLFRNARMSLFVRTAPREMLKKMPFSSHRQDSRIRATQYMHLTRNGFWIMQTRPGVERKQREVE